MLDFTSNSEFSKWLEGRSFFDDTRVLSIDPPPGSTSMLPSRAEVHLQQWVSGSPSAGDTMGFERFRLCCEGVTEWRISGQLDPDDDWFDQGIEIDDEVPTINFNLAIGDGELFVRCLKISIEGPEVCSDVVKPRLDKYHFSIACNGRSLPSPGAWISLFDAFGLEVVWRYYHGEARSASDVPADYTGWYLQLPGRLLNSPYGLFFEHIHVDEKAFKVSFSVGNPGDDGLAEGAAKIVGQFPQTSVQSGNCRVTSNRWNQFLRDGMAPKLSEILP